MKKVEAVIQENKLDNVVNALKACEIGGATITVAKGIGAGKRSMVEGFRGTARFEEAYNQIATIMIVVDDSKIDAVVTAIINAATTGKAGDGKIFISTVDEAFDVATKQSGRNIL